MKLAVPDLISNSYFPAVAAVELGCFREQGLDVELEVIFPVDAAFRALRDGRVDFVGGAAHAALAAFPAWEGVTLLGAQAQGTYWMLVMHSDFGAVQGDLSAVKGRRIGAAPWVDLGLRQVLADAGIDTERDGVTIGPVPQGPAKPVSSSSPSHHAGTAVNFGLKVAEALEARLIDGFWANGMGAEIAVRRGVGTVVLDVRRGDGPPSAFGLTFSALAARAELLARSPETAEAAVRALMAAQTLLRENPARATEAASRLFTPEATPLIAELVRRDAPYYDPAISSKTAASLVQFTRDVGILPADAEVPLDRISSTRLHPSWGYDNVSR